ncbi:MAG: hypothetical protein QOH50_3871 [Kribbellaceae bacterium]|jgi:hypothetical protein|nr:hypothetical protein [Kribbellaceae bacterium]
MDNGRHMCSPAASVACLLPYAAVFSRLGHVDRLGGRSGWTGSTLLGPLSRAVAARRLMSGRLSIGVSRPVFCVPVRGNVSTAAVPAKAARLTAGVRGRGKRPGRRHGRLPVSRHLRAGVVRARRRRRFRPAAMSNKSRPQASPQYKGRPWWPNRRSTTRSRAGAAVRRVSPPTTRQHPRRAPQS